MRPAIQIQNLQKNFGQAPALRGIDLAIRQGEFFGLLGPNGAGKTTTINCIVGLVKPDGGSVEVFGHSVQREPLAAKRCIGFSPQEVNTDRFFSLRRTLEFQGGFHGVGRHESQRQAEEMLRQFGLLAKAKSPFYKLSGGMQKRLMIARAMMGGPQLLILDEPTAGVDVEQRHELWHYLRGLNRGGKTIVLTTHYIDEAEALCERVGIINHGRIIELGSPRELIEKYCDPEVEVTVDAPVSTSDFPDLPGLRVDGESLRAEARPVAATVEKILGRLAAQGRRVVDLNIKRGDLETVFLKLTGKSLQKDQEGGKAAPDAPVPPEVLEEEEKVLP